MLSIILLLDNIGGGEVMVILLFALFFFGSKKIPEVARGLGRATRVFKDAMNGVQNEIHESMKVEEARKAVQPKVPEENKIIVIEEKDNPPQNPEVK